MIPVLPGYVHHSLSGGDVEVGVVIGAYAITGLICRPFAGRLADSQGRRRTLIIGLILSAIAGLLLLVPAGVPGLIFARLVLGAGEGTVFTSGSTWIIDLAPEHRRGRLIGLYGLAVWGGLSLGPLIGALLLQISSYEVVWAFAALAPACGALVAFRMPDHFKPRPHLARQALIARGAIRPGAALALGSIGYSTIAAFAVLHLSERGIGHGTLVFAAFAAMVVLTRLIGGDLPDRVGPIRCAIAAACVEAAGLATIAMAQSLEGALIGALAMGAAFSLLFPSLSLVVVSRTPEDRRGSAMGTFTAFFDLGVGLGAPIAGVIAEFYGYQGLFLAASGLAIAGAITIVVAVSNRGPGQRLSEA